ncbi:MULTISPECIES: hypothetical protein [Clostridium]|nr:MULTISPECIES: hypothetical protein [Clostridium]
MNKYQKEIGKRAKLVKKKTGFSWSWCKWVAKLSIKNKNGILTSYIFRT